MEGWVLEHYRRHLAGQSLSTKWDQHFRQWVCLQKWSFALRSFLILYTRGVWGTEGRVLLSDQGCSCVTLPGSGSPVIPRMSAHSRWWSWYCVAGLALLAREMLAGTETPWVRYRDTLGRDIPRNCSCGWCTREQSMRKSGEQQNIITNGIWQLCETTHCKHKQEAIEVGAKRPRIKKTWTKTWANTWTEYQFSQSCFKSKYYFPSKKKH